MSHARMRNEVYKIQEGTRVLERGDIGGREDKAARTSTALKIAKLKQAHITSILI
jgi:hypothetical protein